MGELAWQGVTVAWTTPSRLEGFDATDVLAMGRRQHERLLQLGGAQRQGFLAGRALIRDLLRRDDGERVVALDSTCERCGGPHGRPRTAGSSLSVSHGDDLVAVAVGPASVSLGVDVEPLAHAGRLAEIAPLFPADAPDLAAWTRIEAAVKADGRGFAIDPVEVTLRVRSDASAPGVWSAVLPHRRDPIDVVTLAGPTGHALSLAIGSPR